ncbi:MAG: hypothetical protein SNJ57_09275 [Cyanobacteriota bacterium]
MNWTVEIDDGTLLICEEASGLEIAIADFDSRKTIARTLSQEVIGDLLQLGVAYPVEGFTEFGPIYLEIIITGSEERRQAILNYGTAVSWRVPIEFGEQLQSLLLFTKAAA